MGRFLKVSFSEGLFSYFSILKSFHIWSCILILSFSGKWVSNCWRAKYGIVCKVYKIKIFWGHKLLSSKQQSVFWYQLKTVRIIVLVFVQLWIEMLPWLSPEVLDCGKFSSASDVWSFGVLMWEIISQGDRPWAGKRPEEIQKAVFCGHKLPVNNTPCSMALYNLMMQCWEPDAKRRPTFAFLSQTFYHFIKQRDALAQQVGRWAQALILTIFSAKSTMCFNRTCPWSGSTQRFL